MSKYFEFEATRRSVSSGLEACREAGSAAGTLSESVIAKIKRHLEYDMATAPFRETGYFIRFFTDLGSYVLLEGSEGPVVDKRVNNKVHAWIPEEVFEAAEDGTKKDGFRSCLEQLIRLLKEEHPEAEAVRISEDPAELLDRLGVEKEWVPPLMDYWYPSFYRQRQPLVFRTPEGVRGTAAELQLAVDLFTLGYWISPVNCTNRYQCAWNVPGSHAMGHSVLLTSDPQVRADLTPGEPVTFLSGTRNYERTFFEQLAGAVIRYGWEKRVTGLFEGSVIRLYDYKNLYWNSRFYLLEHPECELPLCRLYREYNEVEKKLSELIASGKYPKAESLRLSMIRDVFENDKNPDAPQKIFLYLKDMIEHEERRSEEETELLISMIRRFDIADMDSFLSHFESSLQRELRKRLLNEDADLTDRYTAGIEKVLKESLDSEAYAEVTAALDKLDSIGGDRAATLFRPCLQEKLEGLVRTSDLKGFCRLAEELCPVLEPFREEMNRTIRAFAGKQRTSELEQDIVWYEAVEDLKLVGDGHMEAVKDYFCELYVKHGAESPRGAAVGAELIRWLEDSGYAAGKMSQVKEMYSGLTQQKQARYFRDTEWRQLAETIRGRAAVGDLDWIPYLCRKVTEKVPDCECAKEMVRTITECNAFLTPERRRSLVRDFYHPLLQAAEGREEDLELQILLLNSALRLDGRTGEERIRLVRVFWEKNDIPQIPFISRFLYEEFQVEIPDIKAIGFLVINEHIVPMECFMIYETALHSEPLEGSGFSLKGMAERIRGGHSYGVSAAIHQMEQLDLADAEALTEVMIRTFSDPETDREERRRIRQVLNVMWKETGLSDLTDFAVGEDSSLKQRLIRGYRPGKALPAETYLNRGAAGAVASLPSLVAMAAFGSLPAGLILWAAALMILGFFESSRIFMAKESTVHGFLLLAESAGVLTLLAVAGLMAPKLGILAAILILLGLGIILYWIGEKKL